MKNLYGVICGKYRQFEESIELLKILGLINNIEEYQKMYNHT